MDELIESDVGENLELFKLWCERASDRSTKVAPAGLQGTGQTRNLADSVHCRKLAGAKQNPYYWRRSPFNAHPLAHVKRQICQQVAVAFRERQDADPRPRDPETPRPRDPEAGVPPIRTLGSYFTIGNKIDCISYKRVKHCMTTCRPVRSALAKKGRCRSRSNSPRPLFSLFPSTKGREYLV